jgi:hypothetical protein
VQTLQFLQQSSQRDDGLQPDGGVSL